MLIKAMYRLSLLKLVGEDNSILGSVESFLKNNGHKQICFHVTKKVDKLIIEWNN